MKLEPIVQSLLDTDLYKFNMDQVIFHKHTDLCGQYYFKCRNEGIVFTPEMVQEITDKTVGTVWLRRWHLSKDLNNINKRIYQENISPEYSLEGLK